MNSKINKTELLKILQANREKHHDIFLEAQEGYRTAVIEVLDGRLKQARDGVRVNLNFDLIEPVDRTKDYDRTIRMVELDTREEIELTAQEFGSYVLDEWSWRAQFLVSNSQYSAGAAAEYAAFSGE